MILNLIGSVSRITYRSFFTLGIFFWCIILTKSVIAILLRFEFFQINHNLSRTLFSFEIISLHVKKTSLMCQKSKILISRIECARARSCDSPRRARRKVRFQVKQVVQSCTFFFLYENTFLKKNIYFFFCKASIACFFIFYLLKKHCHHYEYNLRTVGEPTEWISTHLKFDDIAILSYLNIFYLSYELWCYINIFLNLFYRIV